MSADLNLRRNTPLASKLAESIRRDGPMTVHTYMSWCLWDEEFGYYSHQPVFGRDGDFITSAEISQVFGELIGIWTGVVWRTVLGEPPRLTLAEYGPGRGTMMRDALRAAKVVPGFLDALTGHLVEASPVLADVQRRTLAESRVPLTWGNELDGFETPAIVIANEFLDSWPVAQWVKASDGWRIRGVIANAQGQLEFAPLDGHAPVESLDALAPDAPVGTIVETQRVDQFADALSRLAARGPLVALVIDYGYTTPAAGDTLQAVRNHDYESPLASPGEADISVHVNFFDLACSLHRAGLELDGPVTQTEFLGALGMVERASRLMAANPSRAAEIEAGAARLIAPNGMGTRFKVMAARSRGLPQLPGLASAGVDAALA